MTDLERKVRSEDYEITVKIQMTDTGLKKNYLFWGDDDCQHFDSLNALADAIVNDYIAQELETLRIPKKHKYPHPLRVLNSGAGKNDNPMFDFDCGMYNRNYCYLQLEASEFVELFQNVYHRLKQYSPERKD